MKTKRRLTVVAVASAAVLVGGVAYASIPDSDGTVHGCYGNGPAHVLSVRDSNASCPAGTTPLDWNQPQGGIKNLQTFDREFTVTPVPGEVSRRSEAVNCNITQRPISGGYIVPVPERIAFHTVVTRSIVQDGGSAGGGNYQFDIFTDGVETDSFQVTIRVLCVDR